MNRPQRIIGVAEVAELGQVTPAAVSNWRKRYEDFPKPIEELKSGPIWWRKAVERWLLGRHKIIKLTRKVS